jgi:5-methylcytosine-specific restriction endonuclease McrA
MKLMPPRTTKGALIPALVLSVSLLVAVTSAADAQRRGGGSRSHSSRSYSSHTYRAPRASYSTRGYRAPRASYRTSTSRRYGTHVTTRARSAPRAHAYTPRISRQSVRVARDSRGRIRRSESAKRAFLRQTGYPHGRPGYVVDHIVPLACGGADAPSNMQWQSREAARAKDRVERIGCGSRSRRR